MYIYIYTYLCVVVARNTCHGSSNADGAYDVNALESLKIPKYASMSLIRRAEVTTAEAPCLVSCYMLLGSQEPVLGGAISKLSCLKLQSQPL